MGETPSRELDLAARQLAAVASFRRAQEMSLDALEAKTRTREARLDASRRLEVIKRQQDALIARSHEQLRATGQVLDRRHRLRAVVAHRNAWFTGKLCSLLEQDGVDVVSRIDNGADAVGIVVAEQPDLVVVEDGLLMLPGEVVVRETRAWSPQTLIAAQVESGSRIGVLLEAGAHTVVTRSLPPSALADELLGLVRGSTG